MTKVLKILNGSFLVAGTSIGGGMLALPVLCARVGLLPSLLVMLGIWIFMTSTALIYLECSTWMERDTHLVTMASRLLGSWGKKVCWSVFIFICYASLVAYVSSGGRMIQEFLEARFALHMPEIFPYLLYTMIFGGLIFLSTHLVSTINSILFITMVSLFLLMLQGAWSVDSNLLIRQDWDLHEIVSLVPMMLCTFSFPGIVPVLASYHKGEVQRIRLSILCGTGITVLTYTIWLMTILGNVPWEGAHGLHWALLSDKHACDSLVHFLDNPWIDMLAQGFAFLALSTSFIGLSVGLSHFLGDAFNISQKTWGGCLALFLMIIIPTLAIKFQFEKVFFNALNISGGVGDAILSGFLPALMLWRGRYIENLPSKYRFYGNKLVLMVIFFLSASILSYEVLRLLRPLFLRA